MFLASQEMLRVTASYTRDVGQFVYLGRRLGDRGRSQRTDAEQGLKGVLAQVVDRNRDTLEHPVFDQGPMGDGGRCQGARSLWRRITSVGIRPNRAVRRNRE